MKRTNRMRNMLLRAVSAALLITAAAAFSTSCDVFMGEDGQDGDAFIAYSWAVGPIAFYTEDPAFAGQSYISNGVYKSATAGTYYFEYIAWDDSYWYGEYTVYVDEGTEGGFLTDGFDGEDIYFELACYSTGPSFYEWNEEFAYRTVSSKSLRSGLYNAAYTAETNAASSEDTVQTGRAEAAEQRIDPQVEREYTQTQVLEGGRYSVILRYGKRDE